MSQWGRETVERTIRARPRGRCGIDPVVAQFKRLADGPAAAAAAEATSESVLGLSLSTGVQPGPGLPCKSFPGLSLRQWQTSRVVTPKGGQSGAFAPHTQKQREASWLRCVEQRLKLMC